MTGVPTEHVQAPPTIASLSGSCTQGTFNQFAARQWPCDSIVRFYTGNPFMRSDLDGAVEAWQTKINAAGFTPLPTFTTTTIPGAASAKVTGPSSGTEYCGRWFENSDSLAVYADATCTSELLNNKGSLTALLQHEIGHAVGWVGNAVHKDLFVAGVSDHCVMHLPNDGSINPTICAHEIEGLFAGYGVTPYDGENFYNKQFVVGSASPFASALEMEVGDTVILSPGAWLLDRGGTVSGSGSNYSWSSTTGAATVSGGTVIAVGAGTTTIRALPSTSSTYLIAHPFRTTGVATTVTITAADPINLAVTGIASSAADSLPIYDSGTYSLLALIGTGDTTGVTYKWVIKYSHIPNDSIVSHTGALPPWGPRASSFTIPEPIGSYTVTVRAIPGRVTIVGTDTTRTVGSPSVRDFTVCPRPGEPMLRAEVPDGEGTNAVLGCS